MKDSVQWSVEKQFNPLRFVGHRLEEIIDAQGGKGIIASKFADRTGLALSTAQTWLSEIQLDLRRKATQYAKGTQVEVHLHRLGILMHILGIQSDDEIVATLKKYNRYFVYPPEDADLASADQRVNVTAKKEDLQ